MGRIYKEGQVLGWVGNPHVAVLGNDNSNKKEVVIRYSACCYNCDAHEPELTRQTTPGRLERGVVLKFDCGTCGSHFESSFSAALSETMGPKYHLKRKV